MLEKRFPNVILATACIPWDDQLEFDEKNFRADVQGLISRGIRHIYLFGTAGEGYAVSDRQFQAITRSFVREMAGCDLFPMIGLISLSCKTMLERLEYAYTQGIRDFMFALPAWGALQDDELADFLHVLCDPYPDCRFIHYNLPRSKRILKIDEYERYAQEMPNLAGAKYSTKEPEILTAFASSNCPMQFFLTEQGFAEGCLQGEFGLLLSVASTQMARAKSFYEAGRRKDEATLRVMKLELMRLTEALIDCVGSRIDGGYDKIFCKIRNPDYPLRLLPPYRGATVAAFGQYCRFLRERYPQWIES